MPNLASSLYHLVWLLPNVSPRLHHLDLANPSATLALLLLMLKRIILARLVFALLAISPSHWMLWLLGMTLLLIAFRYDLIPRNFVQFL